MKTRLNKKSLAAGLAAVVLSTGAFVGASLLVSHDAEASCSVKDKKGNVLFSCAGDVGSCTISALGHTLECSGIKVATPPSAETE